MDRPRILTVAALALLTVSCGGSGDSKTAGQDGGGGGGGTGGGSAAGSGGSGMGTGGGGGSPADAGGGSGGSKDAAPPAVDGAAGGAGGTNKDAAPPITDAPAGGQDRPATIPANCTGAPVPALKQTTVARTGSALHMTGVPGEDTLYILERAGNLRVVSNGMLQAGSLLSVAPGGGTERGALSVALHPKFATNGLIYITYTAGGGETTVDVFNRTSATTATKVKTLYSYEHSAVIHQGGMAQFGPDGYLYLSVGDNGQGAMWAQNPTARFGKILRMDVDTGMPAPGNVMGSYTWHYGLRNPWRWSFDRATGDMYIGHVGQNTYESVDFAPAGQGGMNFGWPKDEGTCGMPAPPCGAGITSAIHQYGGGGKAIIGGYVYRGAKVPGLCGRYFYADHIMGFVHSFLVVGGKATDDRNHPELATGGQVVSFGEGGDGEVYIVRQNGLVTRIEAQ